MTHPARPWLILSLILFPIVAASQERFPTPSTALQALAKAALTNDHARLLNILGPDGDSIVSSGDAVADATAARRFGQAAAQRTRIDLSPDGQTAIARIGKDDWPFPVPLMREGDAWRFDAAAGREELLNRRIGRNELNAIEVCRAYVDAQMEYASLFHEYAQKIRSTSGARDGLFWEARGGRGASPLGPLFAAASAEGYAEKSADDGPAPYHGYLFRILTAQGAAAPGGAKTYLVDGKLTAGFALVAWPATHGSSGVMTFIVNQQGVVFQKDLGENTSETVRAMTAYDPDATWEATE